MLTLTLGFAQTSRPTGPAAQGPNAQIVGSAQGRPAARDLVYLRNGDPLFVVPQGRIFVITGVGNETPPGPSSGQSIALAGISVEIDGVVTSYRLPNTVLTHNLSSGRPVQGGGVISVSSTTSNGVRGFLTGYLEDA